MIFFDSGFGDFVPGSSLNPNAENGQAKLILSCIYVLMGLAFFTMTINLVQEEVVELFLQVCSTNVLIFTVPLVTYYHYIIMTAYSLFWSFNYSQV